MRASSPRPQLSKAHADPGGAAAYIADLTGELAGLARGARHDMLAYFLTMARMEAEAIAHGAAPEGTDHA